MKTSDYLDLAQKKTGARNDSRLREYLPWGKSQMHNYRHNLSPMDNEQALQLAELLEIPVWQIIADMQIQRAAKAEDSESVKKWSKLRKMSKEAGVTTPKFLNLLAFSSLLSSALYILCKIADVRMIDKINVNACIENNQEFFLPS